MTAFHPQLLRCFSRKGRLLPMVILSVRVSRKDGVGISGATVPNVSNRHPAPQQPCAGSTLHYTHDSSQMLLRVNASVVAVPDHLQPRRLTTLLSNLRESGPLASTFHKSSLLVVALGYFHTRVSTIYLV
jgi:hypothetical protein